MSDDQDRAEQRSEWMGTAPMARLCGVSEATVKRRCEDGRPIRCRDGTLVPIQSERVQRPQGWEWRVRAMTAPPALNSAQNIPTINRAHIDQGERQETPPALTSGAQRDDRALDILDTLLRSNADTMERQAEKIAQLTREAADNRALARIAEVRQEAAEKALSDAQAALSAALKRADQAEKTTQSQTRQLELQAEAIAARDEAIREQATALDAARGEMRKVPGWLRRIFGVQ